MKDKYKYGTGQLFNFANDSYLERTSRPVYALVFLMPFIVFYELGTIFINTDVLNQSQIRVVAFLWLQNLLSYIGFSNKLVWSAPALVVIVILIALQTASRKGWRFYFRDFGPMAIECILLAVPLIVLSLFLNSAPAANDSFSQIAHTQVQIQTQPLVNCSYAASDQLPSPDAGVCSEKRRNKSLMANIVTGIGAGIYEELIFRLILICLLMIFFEDLLHLAHNQSVIISILISAALFSAHHHIVFLDGHLGITAPFNWAQFSFRTIAGIYFALLFAIRGFGITAGTHSFYDIIATVINAVFFEQ